MSRRDLAPDSSQLILGWRVWELERDGALGPIAAGGGPWTAGVNEAVCRKADTRHTAPGRGCVCGFNALHRPPLEFRGDSGHALGVVGAWGAVDIYRSGFRAQFATVLGLLDDAPEGCLHEQKLRTSAERYAVPLLELDDLLRYALEYAAPVSKALMPTRLAGGRGSKIRPIRPIPPAPQGSLPENFVGRGVAVNSHLCVDHQRHFMRVGPTPSLAALARDRIELAVDDGQTVEEGETLFVASAGEDERCTIPVPSPVSGKVIKLNEGVPLYEEGAAGSGWLIDLRLERSSIDHSPISWGRHGAEAYRQVVLAAGSDADVLMRSSPNPLPASSLVDSGEARGWLRAFAQALDTAIAANEALGGALRMLDKGIVFVVAGVEELRLAPPAIGESRWVRTATPAGRHAGTGEGASEELRIELSAEELRRYWRGERGLEPDDVSVGGADRAHAAGSRAPLHLSSGTRGDLLLAISLHSRAFDAAREILDGLGNPWFRCGDALRDPIRNLEVLAGFERPDGISPAA